MKSIITLLFSVLLFQASAFENTKTFLDGKFNALEGMSGAKYYRTASPINDSLTEVRIFYLSDYPQMHGYAIDSDLKVLHGECTYYHVNGKIESQGTYTQGVKTGIWVRYTLFGETKKDKYYYTKGEKKMRQLKKSSFAKFRGGKKALSTYCKKHCLDAANSSLTGSNSPIKCVLYVSFDSMGNITEWELMSSTHDVKQQLDHLIQHMPEWIPAYQRGIPSASNKIIKLNLYRCIDKPKKKQKKQRSQS